MSLFLSLKGRQSSILWSVLCRFHWLHHCCHSLSVIAICCHYHSLYYSLQLFITCCTTRCHSLSLVILLVVTLYQLLHHLLSLVVTRCTTRLSFYKRSEKTVKQKRKLLRQRIEAATRGVLWKKMFLNISQNTQESLQRYWKRLWYRCFPKNFANFLRTPFFTKHLWTTALRENIVLIIL